MKKLICILMLFMVAIITPMMAMAETVANTVVDSASGIDLNVYFASLAGLVSLVVLITNFAKKWVNSSGIWTKALSWIVSLIVAGLGYFLHLGVFIGMEWYWILIYAFSSGLIANGIVDIGIVKALIALFTSKSN